MRLSKGNRKNEVLISLPPTHPSEVQFETFAGISAQWKKLRLRIKWFPIDEDVEKPDLLEFMDKWTTGAGMFFDDIAPIRNRATPLSVFGTCFLRSSSSQQVCAFLRRENGKIQPKNTWEETLLDLFDGKWTKSSLSWSKDYTGTPTTFLQRKGQAIIVNGACLRRPSSQLDRSNCATVVLLLFPF